MQTSSLRATEQVNNLQLAPSRPPDPPAINRVNDRLGLQIVHSPHQIHGDIVFVHGLGGSPRKTWSWSSRDPSSFWPGWLPAALDARFRVSTFGYNAAFKGAATNLDIVDFAKDLLLQLTTELGSGQTTPILFVVHSLGGLVVKKAYVMGRHDRQFAATAARIRGIMFLATPHRGSPYARVLNAMLAVAPTGAASARAYIAALGVQSTVIQDISDGFALYAGDLLLVSFYETLKMKVGFTAIMVVDKDSAVMGYENETSASLDADHRSVCKFRDRDDANYLKVKGALKMWALDITNRVEPLSALQTEGNPAQVALWLQEILGVDNILDEAPVISRANTAQVIDWISSLDSFRKWTDQEQSIFWLVGTPGTGKTTLAHAMSEQLSADDQPVQRFFFRRGHEKKCTLSYFIRDMAAQLALCSTDFRRALFQRHADSPVDPEDGFHALWQHIFLDILFKMRLKKPLVMVLDGVDEADEPDMVLSGLAQLTAACSVKIFLTSRPLHAPMSMTAVSLQKHVLQPHDTAPAMQDYVHRAASLVFPDDAALRGLLQEAILTQANGSFLWARLAMEKMRGEWYTREDVERALTQVPHGMGDMYAHIAADVDALEPRQGALARRIIAWVACGRQTLLLSELETALEPEFGVLTNLRLAIPQLCGNFVRIDHADPAGPRADLVHLTVREFLLSTKEGAEPWLCLDEAQERIAATLLKYLCNDAIGAYFASGTIVLRRRGTGPHEDRLSYASRKYPLLAYAVKHWPYHLSKCTATPTLIETMRIFLEKHCLVWIEAVALSEDLGHLVAASSYLSDFAEASRDKYPGQAAWLERWIRDLTRIASNFSGPLLQAPHSAHTVLPNICPRRSMVARTFRRMQVDSLTVSGLASGHWDDCVTTVSLTDKEYIVKVVADEAYFCIMVGSSWSVSIWSATTYSKVATLKHDEYIKLMTLSRSGALLAVCGHKSYFIWHLHSRKTLNKIPRKPFPGVKELRFGANDDELMVIFEQPLVHCISTKSGATTRVIELDMTGVGHGSLGCARNVAVSPDLAQVAIAWPGYAPAAWAIQDGLDAMPLVCPARGPSSMALNTRSMLWRPDASSVMILCQSTNLLEWRLFDDEVLEHQHIKGLDMSVSADGSLLITADHTDTVSLWAFPDLHLVYQSKNFTEPTMDLVFAPGARRFYQVSYHSCGVWEPAALFGDASLDGRLMEPKEPVVVDYKKGALRITALVSGPQGLCYACGRDDGSVTIHDGATGKLQRKVYQYQSNCAVTRLYWSDSDRYLASCDAAARLVVKRLKLKDDGKWAVYPVLDVYLRDTIRQLVFSSAEDFVLVSTKAADRVWDLKRREQVSETAFEEWQSHHSLVDKRRPSTLLQISRESLSLCEWEPGRVSKGKNVVECGHVGASDIGIAEDTAQHWTVIWGAFTLDGTQYIMAVSRGEQRHLSHFHEGLDVITAPVSCLTEELLCAKRLPKSVISKVRLLLRTMGNDVLFLDTDGWIVSFNVQRLVEQGTSGENGGGVFEMKRHYYVPKSWLHGNPMACCMAMGADGTLFCPVRGEVAIVRNGVRR